MARSELTQRVIVAAIGIPLVVVAVLVGRWALGPLLALFCAGAAHEFYRFAEQRGLRPLRVPGMALAAGLLLIATVFPSVALATPLMWTTTLLALLVLSLAAIWLRGVEGQPLMSVAVTAFGAVLPGGAMSYAIFLRHLPISPADGAAVGVASGLGSAATAGAAGAAAAGAGLEAALIGFALVAYPLTVTWVTDSAAFFGGKKWGRKRLIPSVSPGKTVAGAITGLVGGVLGGLLVTLLVFRLWLDLPLHPLAGAIGGLLISAVSQAGDLAESAWKREAGVKDSGAVFPGHGGLLDRMDSLLFTVPASYWWLALLLPVAG